MKRITLFSLIFFFSLSLSGQNVGINDTGDDPHPSAMLDVKSSNKGVLVPRVDCDDKENIDAPAQGLLVFDTCDSLFYYYSGSLWIPIINVNIANNLIQNSDHNTLDEAYNEGGGGQGRLILADSGAVQINGNKNNTALLVNDLEGNNVNDEDLVKLRYNGNKNTIDIVHHSKGSGLSIINDTTATAGKDNVLVYQNSVSTSNKSQAGGRGVSIMVPQANNNKPALEGGTLGTGHGLFGQSGFDSWGLVQALPVAGVMGYSGTNGAPLGNGNSSGGSIEPGLGTTLIRARIGVAGFSYKNHGLLGATYINGGYNGNNPDSIVASVRGTGEFFQPTSGNVTAFDYFAVAGITPAQGNGVIGIGGGHGVIGLSGTKEDATMAGVWGNTRVPDWNTVKSGYSLVNSTMSKGKVGVLGTSTDRVGAWGESLVQSGVVATSGGQFTSSIVPTTTKIGLLATAKDGIAGRFMAEPDTSSQTSRTRVDLGIDKGNAVLVEIDSSVIQAGVVIENKGLGNALEINMDYTGLPNNNEQKAAIDISHRTDTTSAVFVFHAGGDSHGIEVRNESNNAGLFVSDKDSIGIVGTSEEGTAGVLGIMEHPSKVNSAGVHAYGGGHADASAALELEHGAVTVSGPPPKRPAGRLVDTGTETGLPEIICEPDTCFFSGETAMAAVIFDVEEMRTGRTCCGCCMPPFCVHSHPTGFFKDYTIPNDLIDPERSLVFLSATALPNDPVAFFVKYASVNAHVVSMADGEMTVRVTIFTEWKWDLPPFNSLLAVGPKIISVNYFIINEESPVAPLMGAASNE
jgi:hypothetical protein